MALTESFYFEERDWEVINDGIEEGITSVRLNNGVQIEFLVDPSGYQTIIGFNAERDLEEKIAGGSGSNATIVSAHPNKENASAVIASEFSSGNGYHCFISHDYLVIPEGDFLKTYYIGGDARNISVVLDKNNQITNIQADVYVGKDKYLTFKYRTCHFVKGIGFVNPKTNASCRPERFSDGSSIYDIDFF